MQLTFALFLVFEVFVSSASASNVSLQNNVNPNNAQFVSAIYLIPLDKTINPKYVAGIEHALKVLRLWYWGQMRMSPNQGLTFEIDPNPILIKSTFSICVILLINKQLARCFYLRFLNFNTQFRTILPKIIFNTLF